MSYIESDINFLQQANRVIENPTFFRSYLIEDINNWKSQGIGIGIYTKFDLSPNPLKENLLIGIAFPLPSKTEIRHLTMLISGEMSLVRPKNKANEVLYNKYFSNDIYFVKAKNLNQIANFNNSRLGSTEILRNNNESNRDYIDSLVPLALDYAKTLKELNQSNKRRS